MCRAILALVGICLLVACTNDAEPPTGRSFEGVTFLVVDDGRVDSYDALMEQVPFTPLIPSEDPAGASLAQLVVAPSSSEGAEAAARTTDLQLTFIIGDTEDPSGVVILNQSIAGAVPMGGEGEPVDLAGVSGQVSEVQGQGSVWWRHCDLGFLLSFTPDSITQDDAISFASSTISDCPAGDA